MIKKDAPSESGTASAGARHAAEASPIGASTAASSSVPQGKATKCFSSAARLSSESVSTLAAVSRTFRDRFFTVIVRLCLFLHSTHVLSGQPGNEGALEIQGVPVVNTGLQD